jgi:hypothetical protein
MRLKTLPSVIPALAMARRLGRMAGLDPGSPDYDADAAAAAAMAEIETVAWAPAEEPSSNIWDWLTSGAGQTLTQTATQAIGQAAGVRPNYGAGYSPYGYTPQGLPLNQYGQPVTRYGVQSISTPIMLGGLALVAYLLLRK